MLDQEKILQFLQHTGPTLPAKVAKNIGSNILIASAHLSDLASQGKVRISSLKIGGSPLYYLPGQEAKIYPFAAGNINPKDLRVLEKLKQQKVLREENLDVLSKLALRNLKDFAVPIHVTVGGRKQLFWRFHTLTDLGTKEAIKAILELPQAVEDKIAQQNNAEPQEDEVQDEIAEVIDDGLIEADFESVAELIEEPVIPSSELVEIEPTTNEVVEDSLEEKVEPIKEIKTKVKKKEKQSTLKKKPVLQKLKDKILPKDGLHAEVQNHFEKLNILVSDTEVVRKNTEFNFTVMVPSPVGSIKFYCKAKGKKRCDEKDLSSAYMEAQIKKLPLLFLYSHEINKKAQDMLESGAFENVALQKIENGS
tara:strand:+ start:24147 stop:25241 length:1095 start_codon:yes stop_codon:yes gene_type:complete